jgi:hypothetical protein
MMIFHALFLNLLVLFLACIPTVKSQNDNATQWPLHNNGLNTVVQWYELLFQRLLIGGVISSMLNIYI